MCLSGCGKAEEPAPPPGPSEVTYVPAAFDAPVPPVTAGAAPLVRLVLINGCVMCERIDGMARELEKQHGKDLRSERYNAESPGARAYLRDLDMRRHGVVIYDRAGKTVWMNDGHSLDRVSFAAAVGAAVKGQRPPGAAAPAASPAR